MLGFREFHFFVGLGQTKKMSSFRNVSVYISDSCNICKILYGYVYGDVINVILEYKYGLENFRKFRYVLEEFKDVVNVVGSEFIEMNNEVNQDLQVFTNSHLILMYVLDN